VGPAAEWYKFVVSRTVRLLLLVVVLIVLTATAGAFVFAGEPTGPPEAQDEGDNTERVVERLGDAGITTDSGELDALSDAYGVGGAVRILAWADLAGIDPAEITAMRDEGMGWGQIARALEEAHPGTDFKPGIGGIMGGGHGNGWGPGGNPNKGPDTEGDDTGD
jgi:hypothetical protein